MVVIILDDSAVITGSFNFSKSAEENQLESMLIIRDPNLTACYLEDWNEHKVHPRLTSDGSANSHERQKP
jgi:phosphatidylserine/phosphatidylglycerophosphate/cardiolipin synthase-like enzyme